jgi:5-methylcytosine-specific restriction endonuclease McrBC regulatory subunit McrC
MDPRCSTWKLLDQEAADGKHGISQADLYQLLSYATIYRPTRHSVENLAIIYPLWERFDDVIKYHYTDEKQVPLSIVPMPLDGNPVALRQLFSHLRVSPDKKTRVEIVLI